MHQKIHEIGAVLRDSCESYEASLLNSFYAADY